MCFFPKNVIECNICLDNLIVKEREGYTTLVLVCGHVYCKDCLTWLNKKSLFTKEANCVLCRETKFFTQVYLKNGNCSFCKKNSDLKMSCLECGHIFCVDCLLKLKKNELNNNFKCHLCKKFGHVFKLFI